MESIIAKTKKVSKPINKYTMRTYADALSNAEETSNPNRYYLLELYDDIKRDTHLSSAIRARRINLLGLNYSLIKGNGKVDNKATNAIYTTWFKKLLGYVMDAKFYGFSVFEIVNNRGEIDVVLIPRENVIPESEMIKIWPYNIVGDFSYKTPSYKNVVAVYNEFDKLNLGELLEPTKLVMMKSETMSNWAQFLELFGQPMRVATTNSQDPETLDTLEHNLMNMGRSGYMIKDSATTIELVESSGNSGDYDTLINTLNNEISKRILGGTMVNEDGSSRSQSEVHERGFNLITKADIGFVESVINDYVLPILKRFGMVGKQVSYFKFDEPEILTTDEKLKVDQFLIDNFGFKDVEYFNARYGTSIQQSDIEDVSTDVVEDTTEVDNTMQDGQDNNIE